METSPYVEVQGGGSQFAILKTDQLVSKDNCVQLLLDTGGDRQVNILEYLKTEILDDKRQEQRLKEIHQLMQLGEMQGKAL